MTEIVKFVNTIIVESAVTSETIVSGVQGPPGATGPQGTTGVAGPQGPQGTPGAVLVNLANSVQVPVSLTSGQALYNYAVGTSTDSGDRLFIGVPSGSDVIGVLVGGKYYTDLLDTATSLASANMLVKRDSTGKLTGDITGNSVTASKLSTARAVSLAGDVVANAVNFDGSSNIQLSTSLITQTGLVPGTYGSDSLTPIITVNSKGVITGISTQTTTGSSNNSIANIPLAADNASTGIVLSGSSLRLLGGTGVNTAASDNTITIGVNNTVTLNSATQTLTNKTISTNSTWAGNTIALNRGGTGSTTGSIVTEEDLTFSSGGTLSLLAEIIDVGDSVLTNLPTPQNDSDAVTKSYADAIAQSLDIKDSVKAATTANISLSGQQTIDSVSVLAGDRVLVKNQTDSSKNGIWVVDSQSWYRSQDADTDNKVTAGLFTFVEQGTQNSGNGFVLTTSNPIVLDVTDLTFSQFSGGGTLLVGSGLTKTGNTISAVFSGSYTDLTNKPVIPAAQVQSDWNAVSGLGVVLNKPTILDAYPIFSPKITLSVTVVSPQGSDTGNKYFINGEYKPQLKLQYGYTYVFDQSDNTNVYWPNANGTTPNPHNLNFSADNLSGETGGGTAFLTNVVYKLNGAVVTKTVYNSAAFNSATQRSVEITVANNFPTTLYYWCYNHLNMGSSISFVNPRLSSLSDVLISGPTIGQVLKYNGTAWINDADSVSGGAGVGTVTTVSVTSANGFSGTVATASSTPAITLTTSITGVLKGNGTAISAATSGTDYAPGTGALATGIVKSTTITGLLSIAVAGTDYQAPIGTITGLVKGNGANALTAAVAGTDYQLPLPAQTGQTGKYLTTDGTTLSWATVTGGGSGGSGTVTSTSVVSANGFAGTVATSTSTPAITITTSITGVLKGNGTAISAAVPGTDYQAPIGTISGLVKGNGANALTAAVAGTDYQAPITLTTTGSSGAATFSGGTLNIPQYSGGGATAFSALTDATSAGLTVDEIYLPAITRLVVTTPVFNYNIDQYSGDNPAIYVISGTTIAFNLQVSGIHPFLLQQNNANITTANLIHVSTSGAVSTGSAAQGKTSGTLYWKIPASVSGTFRYICQSHASMVGTITINPAAYSATSIDALSDVDTTTSAPANGQTLVWNSVDSKWLPGTVATSGSYTLPTATTSVLGGVKVDGTTITINGSGVISSSGSGSGSGVSGIDHQTYTATAAQTTFAVTYTAPYVNVFVNGVRLSPEDYTATSGTNIVLTTACIANDVVNLVGFSSISIGTLPYSGLTGTVPTWNQNTTGTAAALTTPRAINGVNFDGSTAITITAAAGTLSGNTLASGVTASSLTSVGTIATGVWNGSSISTAYTDAKVTSVNGSTGAVTGLATTASLSTYQATSEKNAANGYVGLDSSAKISSTYLPSYVDDVIEAANQAALPATGETGKIYVTLDTNKTYRWSGSAYVEITPSPGSTDAVTEGTTNKYYTDARARAALSFSQNLSYNSATGAVTGPVLFTGYDNEIHVSNVDGNDTTGNGDLLTPVATITKALTLITGERRTVIVHPGTYTENPSITVQYTALTGPGAIGGNVLISGTLSTSVGCSISGLKMTNLTSTAPAGTGNVNLLNCDISGTLTKSGTSDYTLIRFCDIGVTNITGSAGVVAIFGGNPNFITINNAGARVIVKNAVTIAPVLTAGNANFVDSIIFASTATGNAITSAAGTIVTLANSQLIVPTYNNVARVSLSGFYSIFNCVYDKPNSTLVALSATGGSTNSVDYFQYINADRLILATGGQITFPDATTQTTAYTGTATNVAYSGLTGTVPTWNQNTTGSAATLTTARAIYGNNFDGSAELTQIIASSYGGTGNGFTKFSGPTTAEKTFTLPNASATILTNNAAVTIGQGGTGQTTASDAFNALSPITTTGDLILGSGTNTATRLAIGANTYVLTSNGTTASWQPAASGGSGGSGTTTNALTIGTGLSGTSFNGSSAVTIAIDSTVATLTGTQILTNKRITSRVSTPTVAGTYTIDTDSFDMVVITGQNVNITNVTTTGTPTNGQKLWFSVTGTAARTISFNASNFEASTVALPTTTVTTARLDIGFVWNVATSKWRCVAVA